MDELLGKDQFKALPLPGRKHNFSEVEPWLEPFFRQVYSVPPFSKASFQHWLSLKVIDYQDSWAIACRQFQRQVSPTGVGV